MSVSPESATPDLDFDNDRETAWSASLTRIKQRRAYGRTNVQKRDARAAIKKRGSLQRQQERDIKSNDADVEDVEDEEFNNCDARSRRDSLSSLSSYLESETLLSLGDFPERPKRCAHTRSLSVPGLVGLPTAMHCRSLSVVGSSSTRTPPLYADWDLENANPNIISQASQNCSDVETPPPKQPLKMKKIELDSINEHLKARPRKIRNISEFGTLSSSSFSDLAQSGETWIKVNGEDGPNRRTAIVVDVCDLDMNALSPAKSISVSVSSSRKRCVWEFDDDIVGTPVLGGLRQSRLRVFSPTSSVKLQASHPFIFEEDGNMRETSDSFETSDDDVSEQGSDIPDYLSMNESCNSVSHNSLQANEGSDELPFMPPLTILRSALGTFEENVFGGSGRKGMKVTESEVIRTMPTYENLKFLIKCLRTEKKGSVISSFGKKSSWALAPLGSWSPNVRVAFLQWGTKVLGFTVRSGGGSIAFLQISSTKGLELLQTLEAAQKLYRETSTKAKPLEAITIPMSMEFSIEKSRQLTPRFDFSVCKPSQRSLCHLLSQDDDCEIDSELLDAVQSLGLATRPKPNDRHSGASLSGKIALEPRRDSWDAITDEDDRCTKPPRHSGEHHTGALDLLQNMHGYSPVPTSRCPTRLVVGRQPVCSSPFPGSGRSCPKGRFSFGSECIETPLAKFGMGDWGSHQKGRDWGVSKGCHEFILGELISRFEERYTSEGFEIEASFEIGDENSSSSSVFVNFEVAGAGAKTANLGFEYEADNMKGVQEVSEAEGESDEDEGGDDNFVINNLEGNWRSSVGLPLPICLKDEQDIEKLTRRRMGTLAKHRRVSLCAQMADARRSIRPRMSSFAAIEGEHLSRHTGLLCSIGINEEVTAIEVRKELESSPIQQATLSLKVLSNVFSFLTEVELLCLTSPVCTRWADASTEAHASLMLVSVECAGEENVEMDGDTDQELEHSSIAKSMERPWSFLVDQFPWACFLSEGAFKRVYKVWNSHTSAEEALSVMNVNVIEETGNKHVVGAELAISALLSSLVRRNICPNFVLTRQVFTSRYEPPASHWGCAENRGPRGSCYDSRSKMGRKPRLPSGNNQGRYQYMRMELCAGGDIEEFLKGQPEEILPIEDARIVLFQMAFALHAAADRFSLKHYDVKLLNFFLQTITNTDAENTVLRYGLGSHVFALRMPTNKALVAKLADYGTANVQAESNGQPVTIGHFTTLENTPPDFLILGDAASQSHGHDAFGLGLCMLHLFTGHAPYEEILDEVRCPPGLLKKLKKIWEEEGSSGYEVIRSVILADVEKDDDGVVTDGEPDETFYDTFYRYLVLFGIPAEKFQIKSYGRVWRAVSSSFDVDTKSRRGYGRNNTGKKRPDAVQYAKDCGKYSILEGNDKYIARARSRLESMEGGLELLLSLVNFDPEKRATATDVLNSSFMVPLREGSNVACEDDYVLSFMAYATTP